MYCVGARPAAAANIQVFAYAAFAFVALEVPQLLEELGILPDVLKGLRPDVSGRLRKVTAGKHIAVYIDEADKLSGETSLRAPGRKFKCSSFELLRLPLLPFWSTRR